MKHRSTTIVRVASLIAMVAGAMFGIGNVSLAAEAVSVETILPDLRMPVGVAVRPMVSGTAYETFVADVAAGQVVRVRSDAMGQSEVVITGFVTSSDSDEPRYLPGPHGLLFLDPIRLIVTGGEGQGRPFVRLYELPDQKKPLSAEQFEQQALLSPEEAQSKSRMGIFGGVARVHANGVVPDFLVLRADGRGAAQSIWRLPMGRRTLSQLAPLGDGKLVGTAVGVEPRGHIVIVSADGRDTSRIDFVSPLNDRKVMAVRVKLADVVAVAFSGVHEEMYALVGSADLARGGVYRIEASSTGLPKKDAAAVKVADVQNATSMAFAPDGALLVTTAVENGQGKLLKIVGKW